nr:ribonuclease H-like domain-containing protein [Tanacetum cinerariifolium]
ITTEDMQKRRNDVKARTTLLLALPDENQLRFSKYETAQELWGAILKTFGGNKATKKTEESVEATICYMANKEENHALVVDEEASTEFALMAKSSLSSENKVEARLVEFKTQEIKFCEKIRDIERDVKDIMLYPPPAQVYSPPKKDMSWTGLPEFADDTVTDYSRPTPSIDSSKSNTGDLQNSISSIFEHGESSDSIMSKPMIKFVKAADSLGVIKTNKTKTARKPPVKYAEIIKDETSGILRNFITKIENLKDLKVKIIRCDNGGEFKNKEMNKFCTKKGIKREFSNARTPQQNGVAERRKRTLIEAARIMLADAKLPVTFWAEAVNTASHMESSNSDAQDACTADVSKSSGISNPTATSKLPAAEQIESLTTRHKSKEMEEHSFIATIHQKTTPDFLQFCLFSCFLSQKEPKKIVDALKDPIYQMDVKSAFLYGTINEEVYVMQPPGFQDPKFPDRVYKVENAMYGLYQTPRAWYGTFSKYLLDNGFQR